MALPSTLPPPPPYQEPDILHANEILVKGYCAAQNVLGLVHVDLRQVHFHQERIWSEFLPLIDAVLESTSGSAMRSWCYTTTTIMAELFDQLTKCETLARERFVLLFNLHQQS